MTKTTIHLAPASLSEEEAHVLLEPYMLALVGCFNDGWRNWVTLRDDHSLLATPLHARTRAGFVSDHIWRAVNTRFQEVSGVRIEETRGLRLLVIGDRLVLRFKKLDTQLRSSNIPTRQQQVFVRQLPLEGIPELVRLTMGYVLDKLATEMEEVYVTLPVGKAIEWAFAVPMAGTQVEVSTFVAPQVETRTRKVNIKRSDREKGKRVGDE